jgi:hypothetical protein
MNMFSSDADWERGDWEHEVKRDKGLDRISELEPALREAVKELISLRDDTYDSCTGPTGDYEYAADKDEVDRLDGIIDRCQAALA